MDYSEHRERIKLRRTEGGGGRLPEGVWVLRVVEGGGKAGDGSEILSETTIIPLVFVEVRGEREGERQSP